MDSITLDAARNALTFVPSEDRKTWVRLGKALQDEFGDNAREIFMEWSATSKSFKEKDAATVWKSICRMASAGAPVTIGTLIWEAKQRGWKPDLKHHVHYTAEESARIIAEREARREAARRAEEEDNAAAAAKAEAIWASASPAPADHPYLVRKKARPNSLRHVDAWAIDTEDGRVITVANALLVPIWSSPGKLSSLQAIFPSRKNALKRDKDYLARGRKHGCYFVIGAIGPDTTTVLVCEGYATGDSLHQATGYPVMVAFDAGNVAPVALMVRARMPRAVIVIAADNDQFTKRADGSNWNPGVDAGKKACEAVGGVLAIPQFANLEGESTDFNDLHDIDGLDMVKAQIEIALRPPAPPIPAPAPAPPAAADGEPKEAAAAADDVAPAVGETTAPPTKQINYVLGYDPSEYFRILGYDHERYFFMSHERRQIVVCTKGDFTDTGLLELAPLHWWEENFAGDKGVNKKMAANWLIRACGEVGIYDNSRIRGRGAWIDDGRIIYHHGEKMSIDGTYAGFESVRSRYVYEMDRPLPEPAEEMLAGDEGEWILDMAAMFRWSKPASAALLAGWIALAPICGALRWRPHIWITGGPGTGKSTVLNEFAHYLLCGVDIFAQGNSSEAGIRQTLKADALPVLFDESESNEENDARRVQNILALIRQASTESHAQTLKGSSGGDAMAFHIRSMFALSSVQVALRHQADIERLSILALKSRREDSDPAETWRKMSERLHKLKREKDMPARLFRRSLNLLPITLKSIVVFSEAFAERFGSVRDGDQYGTMLAGAWSLISDRAPSKDEAFEMIDRYDWSEHREEHDTDDSQRALAFLLESRIRMQGGTEVTVSELVEEASRRATAGLKIGVVAADTILQRYGMRITDDDKHLLLSNNSRSLRELLSDTPFAADIRSMLLRVPGAGRYENKSVRFNGAVSKCIAIPLGPILDDDET